MAEITTAAYVQQTSEGGWRIADSRVSLDSVVRLYWEGKSPESIAEEFPSISAEQVYGAIAFYLRNKKEVDEYLQAQDARWQALEASSKSMHVRLLERLGRTQTPGADDSTSQ